MPGQEGSLRVLRKRRIPAEDETKGQDDHDNRGPEITSQLQGGDVITRSTNLAFVPDGRQCEVGHLREDDSKPDPEQDTSGKDIVGSGTSTLAVYFVVGPPGIIFRFAAITGTFRVRSVQKAEQPNFF
jgi:hypothetical protein